MPNVLSPRDLVSRPDNIDETVPPSSSETNVMIMAAVTIGSTVDWTEVKPVILYLHFTVNLFIHRRTNGIIAKLRFLLMQLMPQLAFILEHIKPI